MKLPRAWFIIVSLLWATGASAIECRSAPRDDGRWHWRQVDGQRCYYSGRRVSRSRLHWPKAIGVKTITPSEQDERGVLETSYWPPLPESTFTERFEGDVR